MSNYSIKNLIKRKFKKTFDMDQIQNGIYNEYSGAQKGMNIQPVVKSAYAANDQVEFGSLIKITAAGTYSQICTGKAYSTSYEHYVRGSIVTNGGRVYVANQDFQPNIAAGAFDSDKWTDVAADTIAGIPNAAGDVVCVGKYHNSISVNGFLVEDDSTFTPNGR
jgi:hypothetical protein